MKLRFFAAMAAFFAVAAPAFAKTPVAVCVGGPAGNYAKIVGVELQTQMKEQFDVKIINTAGSPEILRRMALDPTHPDACQLGPTQLDAFAGNSVAARLDIAYELYPEYVHLFCAKNSGVKGVYDFVGSKHVLGIGSEFSGNTVLWKNIVKSDKRFEPVPTTPSGLDDETVMEMCNGRVACTLQVTGLKSPSITNFANIGEGMVLTEFDGRKFDDLSVTVGGKVRDLYTRQSIPGGTYPKSIQPGFFGSSVDTISVPSVLAFNPAWVNTLNADTRRAFFAAINRAQKSIKVKTN